MARSAIAIPGGKNHHQTKLCNDEVKATCALDSIVPQEMVEGSPNPRKVNAASVRIADGTVMAVFA